MHLGYPSINLELNEEDIKSYIKQHTLFEFSNYIPWKIYIPIQYRNSIQNIGRNTYVLNISKNINVIEIDECIYNSSNSHGDRDDFHHKSPMNTYPDTLYNRVIDTGIEVYYDQIINSLNPIQTLEYILPSKENNYNHLVRFDLSLSGDCIAVVNCVHDEISTVPNEHFNLLKKWALRDIIDVVISRRTAYESLETNIGQITLNIQRLESKSQELTNEINEAKRNFIIDKSSYEFV